MNDEDGANDNELDDSERGPSPLPVIPIPAKFAELTIAEQFAYTKPVLIATLNDEYPPTKRRHDNFIKGGAARRGVTDSAGARGVIVPEDVDMLHKHLLRWALRDERRAKVVHDGEEEAEPPAGSSVEQPEEPSGQPEPQDTNTTTTTTAAGGPDDHSPVSPLSSAGEVSIVFLLVLFWCC
jgi:hypothetical protein